MPLLISRSLVRLLPVVVMAAISLLVGYWVAFGGDGERARLVDLEDGPVRLVRIGVEPKVLVIGQPAMLFNGICNSSQTDITVQIYFGAENLSAPLTSEARVDLLTAPGPDGRRVPVRDTSDGRLRRVLTPGCHDTDPIQVEAVPPLLEPGNWHLILHVIAPMQDITLISEPFEVRFAR